MRDRDQIERSCKTNETWAMERVHEGGNKYYLFSGVFYILMTILEVALDCRDLLKARDCKE